MFLIVHLVFCLLSAGLVFWYFKRIGRFTDGDIIPSIITIAAGLFGVIYAIKAHGDLTEEGNVKTLWLDNKGEKSGK